MAFVVRAWARLFPNPRSYGWAVVGLGFLCSALSAPGQSFAISLYLDHLIADLGISRVELSSLYAVATLMAAACLPFIGGLSDRTSGRRYFVPVLVMIALGMLLLSRAESVLVLGAAFFVLRLFGQGAIGLGTLTVTVRWFRRYRGRALAVVGLGYAFGEMVLPGTIYALIGALGWRGSLVALAGVYLLFFVPLIGALLRERSENEGLDGEPLPATVIPTAASQPAEYSFALRQVLRMPVFWALLACVSVPPLVMTAVIFHQVALFGGQGWSPALVPPAFMAFAIGGVVMAYATGLTLERVPSRFALTVSMALVLAAFLSTVLPLAPIAGALLYGLLLGFANGSSGTVNSIIWPDYFGVEALGAIKGVVNAVRNGASAVGPPLAAVLITRADSAVPAFLVFGGLAALAGGTVLALRKPIPPITRGAGTPRSEECYT
jgi:MFS family permease